MIRRKGNVYKLDTPRTSLVIDTEREPELLYYGASLRSQPDYSIVRSERDFAGNDMPRTLFSSFGSNDFRECGIRVVLSDGSKATHFSFRKVKRMPRPETGMPLAYGEEETLRFEFTDEYAKLRLCLYYTVFADVDAICVLTELTNLGKKPVHIRKISSLELNLWGDGFVFSTFDGSWGNERQRHDSPVTSQLFVNESRTGTSSPFHNPFVMLSREGEVYSFNLIYSGNHKESVEGNASRQVRFISGISDAFFDWELGAGETFYAPEAVMVYAKTEDENTEQMHRFVSEHIVRGRYQKKERPVLVNNWEGTYFNFTRERILEIAKKTAEIGAELFVLDDGWFGRRDDDTSSLGDWFDYEEKTGGIASLAEEVRNMGLKFGIWVEPEMISPKSELYEKHPEFAMKPVKTSGTLIRSQLMLNIADKSVQNYIVRSISKVIAETKAAYIKWDHNRYMTDPYGKDIPSGEYEHRTILGLYSILSRLVEKFPLVLFESCASGGGRFDLGMLSFMPQTWTSDNTDARERYDIQRGTSYGYPPCTMGAHVTASPNHQSGHASPIETRFNVACGGLMGYELDPTKCTEEEIAVIKKQISFYKKYRELFCFGTFYRLDPKDGGEGFMFVSPDKAQAIVVGVVKNKVTARNHYRLRLKGLDPSFNYSVKTREQSNYKEELSYVAGGDLLLQSGIQMQDIFSDTENQCNSLYTRMYVLKKISSR
ncbi:MAG: alpha-galactosidase [Clostridia bacterium]|nr:alpha-galactosidase [Clostridia bacterium]